MDAVDAVVIGAGVVGLAIGRALANLGLETIVIEAAEGIGTGVSSRNSEVIHAGLYYPAGSLKARLCVEGRERLYEYCASRGVEHRRTEKLVVATEESEISGLASVVEKARVNGVKDVQVLTAREAMEMEPNLRCVGAMWSPSTGIIDSHGLMLALQGDLERAGGAVAFNSAVERIELDPDLGHVLHIAGEEPMQLRARTLVNSAGLDAVAMARRMQGLDPQTLPTAHYCKGSYYSLLGRAPFTRLIYPLPQHAGLGVHLTLDLGGQARFGPDVEWLPDDIRTPYDYTVDLSRADGFYAEVRRYWPGLPDHALQPAYSGIRPKIHGPNEPAPDFMIHGPAQHGVSGLLNLFGIESPGLTSSLALADEAMKRLGLLTAAAVTA